MITRENRNERENSATYDLPIIPEQKRVNALETAHSGTHTYVSLLLQ